MTGFEPVTFCTQNKRATKLHYIPFPNCCTMPLYTIPFLFFTSPLRVALQRHSDTGTRVRNELIELKPYTISSFSHPSGAAFIAALTHSTVKCDSSSWDISLSGWQSIRKFCSVNSANETFTNEALFTEVARSCQNVSSV